MSITSSKSESRSGVDILRIDIRPFVQCISNLLEASVIAGRLVLSWENSGEYGIGPFRDGFSTVCVADRSVFSCKIVLMIMSRFSSNCCALMPISRISCRNCVQACSEGDTDMVEAIMLMELTRSPL